MIVKRLILLVALAGMLMLSGCGSEAASVAVIGGADGPTAVAVGEQTTAGEYEDFFRELYADDLLNKYTQLSNDWTAFDAAYYSEDTNIDDVIATTEKCISTLEAIIAIEPPATLVSYHQDVIDGAQYEIEYYKIILNACLMAKGEAEFSEQEITEMDAFLEEYTNVEIVPLHEAIGAVMDAMGYE